jgi:GR25 family glycosyltransferase involved in LPS biosynthesis
VVHSPAENDEVVDNAVQVSWTASSSSDFVDVHICEGEVLRSSQCVLVRSSVRSARGHGEEVRGNVFTLRIGGEPLGRKDWIQLQEPYDAARPLINGTLALDARLDKGGDDAARERAKLLLDTSAALPRVFVIVLDEDERRVDHFRTHIARRLPEAEQFSAFNAKEDAVGTAEALDRLRVTLSKSERSWLGQRVGGLQEGDAWVSTALAGQIGVTASQVGVWERVALSDPEEVPYAVILEDDATLLPTFRRDTVRAMVDELDRGIWMDDPPSSSSSNSSSSSSDTWHVAYIYLRPEDFPKVSDSEQNQLMRQGGYAWSLLAYVVSHAGAQRLLELARSEPLFGPIDDMISMWQQRGLVNVAFPRSRDQRWTLCTDMGRWVQTQCRVAESEAAQSVDVSAETASGVLGSHGCGNLQEFQRG